MNEQERIAAFVTLHGLEISLEAGLIKIRELRKQFEALEPKAPGSSGPTAPTEEPQIVHDTTGPVGVVGAVKGKRRARCSVCNALHWNGHGPGMLCNFCTKIAKE